MTAELHLGEFLTLRPVLPVAWVAVVVAALGLVMVLAAWRWPLPISRGRRGVLLFLRLLVMVAVAMLLVRPQLRWQGRREVRSEVAVFVDASRSMAIRDAAKGGSDTFSPRIGAVRAAFATVAKPYADLASRAVIRSYAFGTHARSAGDFAPEPTDPRTDLAEALGKVSGPFSDRLAAVIVVSDGRANRSQGAAEPAARRLAAQGVKVHTVAVGSPEPTGRVRDVAVGDLRAPGRVFVGNRPEVRCVVRTLGLNGAAAEAVLSVNGKDVERRRIVPASHRTTQELVFTPEVGAAGLARVAVAVAPLPDELVATNNRAETTVRVEEGGIRVLYLDGRLHPEGKYIARALGAAKEIELERRILVGGRTRDAAPRPADLDAASVVVLGDLPASALPAETIGHLADRVRTGGLGLLTLGGLAAYGPGGWAATPLAEILPVTIRSDDGQIQAPVRFQPTADGRQHFIFKAGTADDTVRFDAMPPLSGANAVGLLHPTARLLAAADGKPLLAVREFAAGRVASLTVDTTWQWALAPGGAEGAAVHRRFWRQMVLWVAGRDGRPQNDLWVMTDRSRYLLTDPDAPPAVEVTVGAPAGAVPRVRLTGPVTVGVDLRPHGPKEWRGTAPLPEAGTYTLVVEADVRGEKRRAETSVGVEVQDFELAEVLADHEALRRIAEAGGGTFRTVDGLGALLAELADGLEARFEPAERRTPLASGRMFLAAVILLLAVEWVLRRRWAVA